MYKICRFVSFLLILMAAACSGIPETQAPAADEPAPQPTTAVTTPAETAETPTEPAPIPTAETDVAYPYPPPVSAKGLNAYPEPTPFDSGYPSSGASAGGCEVLPPDPQSLEFMTEDGLTLAGTYYPAAGCDTSIVLLMHQFGSTQDSWTDLARWLQNRSPAENALGWFPAMPEELSLGVFAFDFRSHGQSQQGGDDGIDTEGFLLDAQAALGFVKTLPNAHPDRIITLGASIGADASLDACLVLDGDDIADFQENRGCIGAFALSPGSFLDVPYVEAAERLSQPPFNMEIACAAADQDGSTASLCGAAVPGRYTSTIYTGRSDHGIALLQPGLDPDIGQVLLSFILRAINGP